MQPAIIAIMLIIICFQLPFGICNLVFATTEPTSACMDNDFRGLILRNWLLGIGITEVSLLGFLVFCMVLYCLKCCSVGGAGCALICVWTMLIIKDSLWVIMIFVLYFIIVDDNCTGGIKAYFITLMVLICVSYCMQICYKCCCEKKQ